LSYEFAQRFTVKGLQTGEVVYFGALHLVNRAINLVATYITVRCTFVKPKMPIYEGQLLTPKGQRPVILVEQRQKCFYQVQRTEICCRFYQVHLNHTQALLYRAFILISTLRYISVRCTLLIGQLTWWLPILRCAAPL